MAWLSLDKVAVGEVIVLLVFCFYLFRMNVAATRTSTCALRQKNKENAELNRRYFSHGCQWVKLKSGYSAHVGMVCAKI
jgi:hypothetical protein